MRICMLTSSHNIFDNRIYYKEILSLKKYYDDIYLIAPGDKDFVTEDGIKVRCFKKRRSWYDRLRPMRDMFNIAKEVNADIYHAHEPDSFQVAVKLKKRFGKKIIFDSHEYYPEAFAEHFGGLFEIAKKMIYIYEKSIAIHADYIVTVNDILVNKFKEYNNSVELITNYPVLEGEINKTYSEKPVFVYAGGLSEDRGILKTLEAIKLSKKDAKYLFIGNFRDKETEDRVMDYVANNLKEKDVEFTGRIGHKEVIEYLKKAYAGFVLLQPKNWRYVNSEPIKLFEYMMSKTAVIASDFPMMASIVEAERCGVVVNPVEPKDIAEAIDYLIDNREIAIKMGENGYRATVEKYNWEINERKLLIIYRQIEGEMVGS
ncbi:Alpha-D-kanosaminyltransferase [Caloramator mitchellensis]|uniref:Alpha-D-kanosaminyltransferase n=1 Tax=Caloramator mitchellensis TaxID=908809 RepID=A0A0R3JYQ6_CALMK|nr:glycosyltransferase family 4 protein [Caloramator mitchellensis]KRQ87437.1 Alpha-D-kanosaminyltransferase [Caloramator mitchellensis]